MRYRKTTSSADRLVHDGNHSGYSMRSANSQASRIAVPSRSVRNRHSRKGSEGRIAHWVLLDATAILCTLRITTVDGCGESVWDWSLDRDDLTGAGANRLGIKTFRKHMTARPCDHSPSAAAPSVYLAPHLLH